MGISTLRTAKSTVGWVHVGFAGADIYITKHQQPFVYRLFSLFVSGANWSLTPHVFALTKGTMRISARGHASAHKSYDMGHQDRRSQLGVVSFNVPLFCVRGSVSWRVGKIREGGACVLNERPRRREHANARFGDPRDTKNICRNVANG